MTLFDVLNTYIMPYLIDVTRYNGDFEKVFYGVCVWALSLIVAHCFVWLPYKMVLKVCGLWKKRGK